MASSADEETVTNASPSETVGELIIHEVKVKTSREFIEDLKAQQVVLDAKGESDLTDTLIEFTYAKSIPRDATDDSFSFSFPFSEVAGNQYKMRVRSDVAISVTFNDVSFDLQSISIV